MKTDQVIILVFLILGIVAGVLSRYIIANTILATLITLFIYIVANVLFVKFVKSKRIKLIVLNSFATYFPMWLIVWILLFNL